MMTTLTTDRADEHDEFPFTFTIPSGFHPMNLAEEPLERARTLNDQLERAMPGLTGEQQLHVLLAHQYSIERMLSEGVVYAANFVGRSDQDPTAASTAQFAILLREGAEANARPLETLLDAVRERKQCAAQLVDLPIGRCLLVVEDDLFASSVNVFGQAEESITHVRQMQVIFPLPERRELALFTLSTEFLRDWDDYVEMMAEICKTITWREKSPGRIATSLDGQL